MVVNKVRTLYLSDTAWQQHARWAVDNYWCRASSINTIDNPGNTTRVSRWFVAISHLEYIDTRPDFMLDTPIWTDGELAHRRTVRLLDADDTIKRLAAVAFTHRVPPRWRQWATMAERPLGLPPITSDAHYKEAVINGAGSTATAYAAAVLEAIGLRYLTPDTAWPQPAMTEAMRRAQRRREQQRVEQAIGERMNY